MGKAFVYGDDINTDVLFAGKYTYTVTERSEMAKYALEDLDPAFRDQVKPGDVIVAGKNFGCGSSREQAVICLTELGVAAVIADSFARIYFRNAINQGLPVIALQDAARKIQPGDEVTIDLAAGKLTAPSGAYSFPAFSPEVQAILDAGGLVAYTQQKLQL
ncbi:3-isopropylmalate dehydratase [bacterium]|nr:3-isopropylmalate dehydratase [bacterium]